MLQSITTNYTNNQLPPITQILSFIHSTQLILYIQLNLHTHLKSFTHKKQSPIILTLSFKFPRILTNSTPPRYRRHHEFGREGQSRDAQISSTLSI